MATYDLTNLAAIENAAKLAGERADNEQNQDSYNAGYLQGYASALRQVVEQQRPTYDQRQETVASAHRLVESIFSNQGKEDLWFYAQFFAALRVWELDKNLLPEDQDLLARKTRSAGYNSVVPLLMAERIDAVCTLLEKGITDNRSFGFPPATPEQMAKLLLSCDEDVFSEIVDTVAIDNQSLYAPDNEYSLSSLEEYNRAVAAIQEIVSSEEAGKHVSASHRGDDAPAKWVHGIYKEISEDLINELSNILLDGFYSTHEEICAEFPLPEAYQPGRMLVVLGEINDAEEKFYSVAICENVNGEQGESLAAVCTATDDLEELRNSVETVLARLDEKMQARLFIVDDELLINDDRESVNAYLWAVDGLVDRLPASEEMENINFYADYNVKTGEVKVTATYDTPMADGELNKEMEVDLTSPEKRQLIAAINNYCIEKIHPGDCLDLVNRERAEEGLDPISVHSAKSSLDDVIRSASAKSSGKRADAKEPEKEIASGR